MKHFFLAMAGVGTLSLIFCELRAQDATKSVWDGVYSEQQANRGLSQYNQHCLDCHGEDLEGDQETPPLRGGRFAANWDGQRLGDLFLRIRRDMPLNSEAGTLSSAVTADLLAYILSLNGFPPGRADLPRENQLLNEIRFESAKRSGRR